MGNDNGYTIIGIVGAVVVLVATAVLRYLVTSRHRDVGKWKQFQEEVGLVRLRFDSIKAGDGIEGIIALQKSSLHDLEVAAQRVLPYVVKAKQARLLRLVDEYRTASQRKGTGFLEEDMAGMYKDPPQPLGLFPDPKRAVETMVKLLDDMAGL